MIGKQRILPLLAVALVALASAGCGSDEGDEEAREEAGAATTAAAGGEGDFLAVLAARSGSLVPSGNGFMLELGGLGPQVTAFSERPRRESAAVRTEAFLDHWANEYGGDPPNAALAVLAGDPGADTVALTLQRPTLADGAVRFRATRLEAPPGLLDEFGESVDASIPRRFDDTSLFIDAGGLMQLVAYGSQDVYATGGGE